MAINTSAANFADKKWTRDIAITMTHEFAHVLTLNSTQVDRHVRNAQICAKKGGYLSPERGCAFAWSYINKYVSAFWGASDISAVVSAANSGKPSPLYKQYPNDFTTQYAATDPEEDMAEAFTDFVLLRKPTGSLKKDQKVLFFYQYPELVALRASIRAAIAPYFN